MREYLYSIICAGIISTGITAIAPKSKSYGKLITMLAGLFLLLSAIWPLKNIDLSDISFDSDLFNIECAAIVSQGIESTSQSLRQVIKEKCTAYVMEKAKELGADVTIEIVLSDGDEPLPYEATVSGAISPYAKERLVSVLEQDLGIPKERQKWI